MNKENSRNSYHFIKFIILSLTLVFQFLWFGCQRITVEKQEEATLQFIIGDVNVNGQSAQINQIIKSNSIIETGLQSIAEVRLGKHSGTQIREKSKVEIANSDSGWDIIAHQGAVLNLIKPGTNFNVRGPAAVIAVRGTIFYTNTYEDSTQYICTCNGSIAILDDVNINKTISASHHEGYTAVLSNEGQTLEPTPMKEHSDLEIFEFMYRIEHPSETD